MHEVQRKICELEIAIGNLDSDERDCVLNQSPIVYFTADGNEKFDKTLIKYDSLL